MREVLVEPDQGGSVWTDTARPPLALIRSCTRDGWAVRALGIGPREHGAGDPQAARWVHDEGRGDRALA